MSGVTRILSQSEDGNEHATEEMIPLAYEELKKLASVRMAKEKPWRSFASRRLGRTLRR